MKAYPITYWFGPPVQHTNEERYREIAEAGFTLINAPAFGNSMNEADGSYEHNIKILDLAHRLNMKALISDRRMKQIVSKSSGWKAMLDCIIADYKNHPALEGYYVFDEPGAGLFPHLGEIVEHLRKQDPDHEAYINLLPNYASQGQLQTNSYYEYLERYVNEVKPALVSYDHYHFMQDQYQIADTNLSDEREKLIFESSIRQVDRPGFFENIEMVRRVASKNSLPFMVIILLVTHGAYRDLTEAELRWEVFQSLAYGAAVISYFTYWTPEDEPIWCFRNGIITWEGERTEHYERVKRINHDLQTLGGHLQTVNSTAVYHIGEENENGCTFQPTEAIKQVIGGRATLGMFEQGYVLFANQEYNQPTVLKIVLGQSVSVSRIDKQTGSVIPLAPDSHELTIHLAAGDGELLVIKTSK